MAIINHTYNFAFVHVPKSAGTSIVSSLSALTRYRDIECGGAVMSRFTSEYYATRFGITKHSTAAELQRVVGEAQWDAAVTFGFVRHPLDRLVSSYFFLKNKFRNWPGSEAMDAIDSLDAFVESAVFASGGPGRILRPQVFWLCEAAPQHRLLVTTVGKVETIGEDFDRILDRLGLPAEERAKVPPLAVRNKSPRDQEVAPSARVVETARRVYADDLTTFGYDL